MLQREFYKRDGLTLARELIGKVLVHRVGGVELAGIISETEAYMGVTDKASHAYGGRRTARTETMYLEGGFAYVYRIYGIYFCMNVTAGEEGSAEAVLIRGVLPHAGKREIWENYQRFSRKKLVEPYKEGMDPKKLFFCTAGPGKLCLSMAIGGAENRTDMLSPDFFIRDDGWRAARILTAPRIGIDYAEEAALYPWRFTAELKNGAPFFTR